jgi:hypothetical protein
LGCLLIYAAALLREDEEGVYQNRVEEWWIRIMYKRDAALSVSTAFMKGVAGLTGRVFDGLFGKRLFSVRGIGASVCYSAASLFLCGQLLIAFKRQQTVPMSLEMWAYVAMFFLLGSVPAIVDSGRETLWIWGLAVFATLALPIARLFDTLILIRGHTFALGFLGLTIFISGISFGCDVLFIALTRWMLRNASRTTELPKIVGIILIDCLLGIVLAVVPFMFGVLAFISVAKFKWSTSLGIASFYVMFGSALNFVDVIACSVFLILMLLILLHRLIWPVVERPLYAFARYGVIKNKKLLWTLGGALILAPQGVAVSKWVLDKLFS